MVGSMLRRRSGWAGLAAVVAVSCLGAAGGVAAAPLARAAHSLTANEHASLHLVKKNGSILHESGSASGTLPGSVSATFNTSNTARVTGSVTFHPAGGSITVTVLGYPQSLGTVAKVSGSVSVRGGTGRYRHAAGSGSFTGSVNRRTWRVTVNARVSLHY